MVRKKAREWVHRNKEKGLAATKKPREKKREDVEADFHAKKGMEVKRWLQAKEMADPLTDVAAGRPDPFDMFPAVGRRVDHIIEYCEFPPTADLTGRDWVRCASIGQPSCIKAHIFY